MKKIVIPLPALVLTLGLMIALVTPALADHYKYLYKGLEAQVYWYMYDEDTRIYTDISVYAIDGINQNPPGSREQFHYLNIWIYQYSYDADGNYVPIRDVYFYGDILPGSIAINHSLTSAGLTAYGLEGWQYDYAAELETPVIFDIEVSWSAIGPLNNSSSNSHYRYPYGFYHSHSTGKSREASILGEVVYDGIIATLGASGYGYIASTKDGYMSVEQ